MTIATGVAKQLIYKAESAWNTAAGTSGGQKLRRVASDLNLKKDTFESNEIVTHFQRIDYRHGLRRVEGSINGELSPGTYKDFVAAAVRRAYAAVTATTSVALTIGGSGPTYTVVRGTGSYLSDGYKIGMVVRLSIGGLAAANLSKNLLIVDITSATSMTVLPLNGVALTAEGPISGCTITATGKVTYVPTTGHTDTSFSIEQLYNDLTLSELYTGCKIDQMDFGLPPTGMASIGMKMLGGDVTTAASAYFSSPTNETTTGILAAVNGILAVNGSKIATLTGHPVLSASDFHVIA
jgi:hypothetical protein